MLWAVLSCDVVSIISFIIRILLLLVVALIVPLVIIFLVLFTIILVFLLLLSQIISLLMVQLIILVLLQCLFLQKSLSLLDDLVLRLCLWSSLKGLMHSDLTLLEFDVMLAAYLGIQEVTEKDKLRMEKLCEHVYMIII